MDITGANNFKDSAFYNAMSPGSSTTVNFGNYKSENTGINDIHVYILSDSNASNNSLHYRQEVSREKYSHVDTSKAPNGIIGYGVGFGGMILHKYHVDGKRSVVKTGLFVSNQTNNVGKIIYGVVLD